MSTISAISGQERRERKQSKTFNSQATMSIIIKFVAILAVFHLYAGQFSSASASGVVIEPASLDNQTIGWWIPAATEAYSGSIEESEYQMDSEINRRILAMQKNYIGYGSMKGNHVPCSRRGASYYNCRAGAQANPYSRGCSRITLCRG